MNVLDTHATLTSANDGRTRVLEKKFAHERPWFRRSIAPSHGFFKAFIRQKAPKKFTCYKRYKNSRKKLDEEAKFR
jgi:hypothetical protein